MSEFGHRLSRRSFLKLGGLYTASAFLLNRSIQPELTPLVLPEKLIRQNQTVSFIMPTLINIGNDILDFEKATNHRVQGVSLFADLDLKPPSEPLIDALLRSDRAVMINLQPRPTLDAMDIHNDFTADDFIHHKHDKILTAVAKTFSRFAPTPIFVRLAFEMNGDWFTWGGNPNNFKKIWNYIVDFMKNEGATNVKWIFSPNYLPHPENIEKYYPGDNVDVIAADIYDWEHKRADYAVGPINYYLKRIAPEKPIMVGELGAAGRFQDEWLARAIYLNLANGASALNYFQIDKEKMWALRSPDKLPLVRQVFNSGFFLEDSADLNKINSTILTVN